MQLILYEEMWYHFCCSTGQSVWELNECACVYEGLVVCALEATSFLRSVFWREWIYSHCIYFAWILNSAKGPWDYSHKADPGPVLLVYHKVSQCYDSTNSHQCNSWKAFTLPGLHLRPAAGMVLLAEGWERGRMGAGWGRAGGCQISNPYPRPDILQVRAMLATELS